MLLQRFEWLQLDAMLKAARKLKPQAFVDIGANFGLYTCVIGQRKLVQRLIAFEPSPEIVTQLQSNIALNGLSEAEIHPVAAGAHGTKRRSRFIPKGMTHWQAWCRR